jgi:hypothetical protein
MSRALGICALAVTLLLASDALVGCSSSSSPPPGATDDGGEDASEGASPDSSVDGGGDAEPFDSTVEGATGGDTAADADAAASADTAADADTTADADAATDASEQLTDASADGAADARSDAATDGGYVEAGGSPSDGSAEAGSDASVPDGGADAGLATLMDGATDALADASEEAGDAGDGGSSETLSIILSTQGSDCAACAAAYCLVPGQTCEALGTAVAASGPSAGTLRSTLCFDTLSCLVDSTPNPPCYEEGAVPEACYCGPTETSGQCATNGPGDDAQCGTQELAGLETTDPATAISRFNETTTTLGAQMANAIVDCLDGAICGNYCLF